MCSPGASNCELKPARSTRPRARRTGFGVLTSSREANLPSGPAGSSGPAAGRRRGGGGGRGEPIMLGSLERGLALLDDAMVRILTRTTSPRSTSAMYCAAIGSCYEVHEIARALEWSVALDKWLGELPRLGGAYFGNCRIYRALLMRLRGDWSRAAAELAQACGDLHIEGQLVAGHAWYELGELRRLQGDPSVEEAYQQAVAGPAWTRTLPAESGGRAGGGE